MDRREFFRRGARKAAEVVVRGAEARVAAHATHWIRPPYALAELDFLLACTRCGDCTRACPHGVIFPLPARLGAQAVGTPALDLLGRGCHLCADWPCVGACQAGALQLPERENGQSPPPPRLAEAEIDAKNCLPYSGPECGACADACPIPGAMIWDMARPRIDKELCTGCALCREACIVETKAVNIRALHRPPHGDVQTSASESPEPRPIPPSAT